jgi:hypothetical protein
VNDQPPINDEVLTPDSPALTAIEPFLDRFRMTHQRDLGSLFPQVTDATYSVISSILSAPFNPV